MTRSISLAVVALAACHSPIGPDPTGGTGAASTTGQTSSGVTSTAATSSSNAATSSSSSGTPNTQAYASGSRLKARRLTATDGAIEQIGWHDSQLNVDCAFSKASDGQTRCLPFAVSFSMGAPQYSDATCTQLVTSASPCHMGATYAIAATGACSDELDVWPITATIQGPAYQSNGGACSPINGSANGKYFVLGPMMSPTAFVAATESIEP